MSPRHVLLILIIGFLSALHAAAPNAAPLPSGGVPLLPADSRVALLAGGQAAKAFGGVEIGDRGVRLITLQQPEFIYSLQANVRTAAPVHKGDTLFLRFSARSLLADKLTGVTKLRVSFGRASPPWENSYRREIGANAAWQIFEIPFAAAHDFAAGEAHVSFSFGFPTQEVEVANVELFRFEPKSVTVQQLPRTRHSADPIPPEILARELTRIATMKADLAAVSDPAPAAGRTLHVSAAAAEGGDGSTELPFRTLPAALARVQPGDTVLVSAGEYREREGISIRTSGRPDAWIKLRAAPGARPKIISSGWSGFELRGGVAYVEIAGFELTWEPAPGPTIHGVGIAPMYASHHLRILDNVVHDYGTGGICSLDCDYVHLEGNVVYRNAKTSPYGGSGISLCRAFDFDQAPGYHNVVRRNIVYDNELTVATAPDSGGNNHVLTDGNGIIIDVFNRSRANPLKPHTQDRNGPLAPYHGRTLIEDNLVYDNGGRGIHVFRSDRVDVLNNTTYMNQKSADINAGEITVIESAQAVVANNLAYGRAEKRGLTQDGSRQVIWTHNLFFHADDILLHDALILEDPLFVAPAPDAPPSGFRLQLRSPARGRGLTAIARSADLTGREREANQPVDLGAYQEFSSRP